MIRIYITQRKNNLFFNVLNENNIKVYYNSIGIEVKGKHLKTKTSKNLSSSLIEVLVNNLLKFTLLYIKLDSRTYFIINGSIFKFFSIKKKRYLINYFKKIRKKSLKIFFNYLIENKCLVKKIYIFIYLDILDNYEFFLTSLLENINKFNLKFDKIFFLNKFSHGSCKFKKNYY